MNDEPFERDVVAPAVYPPAPWYLRGWGLATVQPVDIGAARAVVPAGLTIVAAMPGKTLGGLLFVSYACGSTLVYRELNIVAALVRVRRRVAFYLPRLYVDSAASLAGGRAIWAVPKRLATFEIAAHGRSQVIAVHGERDAICRLTVSRRRPGMPGVLPLPAFGTRAEHRLFFTGRLRARICPVDARIEMSRGSEFAALGLDRPALAFALDDLRLLVPPPVEIAR